MDHIDLSVQERPKVKLNPAASMRDLKDLADAMTTLAVPGYDQASVTEIAKGTGAVPADKSGRGPEYGSVVHRCLEWMANNREPCGSDIESMCAEFDLQPAPVEEIQSELQRVKQSDLWCRAMSAAERHTEVPFSLMEDRVLVSGIIDLAFREGERWSLVDYKTDRITGDATEHVTFYAPQLRLYAHAWEKLTGRPPSDLMLFFTDTACAIRVLCGCYEARRSPPPSRSKKAWHS